MADNSEHPGQDQPYAGDPVEGSPPAQQSGAPDMSSSTPNPHPPSAPLTPSPGPAAGSSPRAVASPSTYKRPEDTPVEEPGIKMSPFPAVLGLVLVGVLIAAWFVSRQKEASPGVAANTPPPATAAAEPVAPVADPAESPESSAKTEALEGKVKELTGEVERLAGQVKAFEGKLNNTNKPEPAPDLKPLEGKVNDLAKSVAVVAPLHEQVGKLGDRVGSVDGALKSVKGELAALKEEIQKAAPAATEPEPKPEAEATSAGLTGGIDLFKAGKYKEAGDVFSKLATAKPNDARVYYYAALTRGLTTSDWQGETLATAAKGAALEKAGAPKPSEVDAAFADLPATLKPWMTFFRQQAK